MRAGLELFSGETKLLWWPLDRDLITVGSNPDCDVCIPDARVAPVQLLLRDDGDYLFLCNKSSTGTVLNGEDTIHEMCKLAEGDRIALGPLHACVRFMQGHAETRGEYSESPEHPIRITTRTLMTSSGGKSPRGHWVLEAPVQHPGKTWPIDAMGVLIGSDGTGVNDVVLTDDPYVSASHARLYVRDGRCVVIDQESRNGVFAGDQRIKEGEVQSGVQIRLGQSYVIPRFVTAGGSAGAGMGGGDNKEASAVADARLPRLLGSSDIMRKLRETIRRVAQANAPVLITGETGTGKEVVARLLVALSQRSSGRFVALNCGALGRNLIESELFGHERGAFTGALARKVGAFEAADGGTLFLDEIGELPLELQPQLLRVLELGEVRRVGATDTLHVDVRLIAATHRSLAQEVAEGRFREDLFHRLHVLWVHLPALRERPDDIAELALHFLREFAPPEAHVTFHADAMAKLAAHGWPGNVRELRNVIQRAVLMRTEPELRAADIVFTPSTVATRTEVANAMAGRTLMDVERAAIVRELARQQGNKKEAAAALGISRSTIHRKIDELEIDVARVTGSV